jgi:pimeloyl-ACP methyl ester carboxylesterase
MRILKAGLLYFAIVMGAGFVLGPIRILWVVPRFGTRMAELMETPIMLVVIIVAALWIARRLALPSTLSSRLGMGCIALGLMLVAEFTLVPWLRGLSISEYLASRDPVSGTAYYVMLGVFAIMPLLVARRDNMNEENMIEAKATAELAGWSVPTLLNTRLGAIEYVASGEGATVLALHGAMGGYDQGRILVRTIGEPGYRYVSVSRPGYLGTPLTAGRTPGEQADLYAELLDGLDIRQTAVMAISGGGPSAIHFALRHRDRCRGLVLISTCAGEVDTPIPFSFKLMKLLVRWPAFVALMKRRTKKDLGRALRRSICDPIIRARTVRDPQVRPLIEEVLVGVFDRITFRLPGTENDIGVTQKTTYPLEQIAVPVLVVHGTEDRLVPFMQHGKLLAARIPGAQLLAVEGGEHMSIFTHRDEVRSRVTRFLRDLAPA